MEQQVPYRICTEVQAQDVFQKAPGNQGAIKTVMRVEKFENYRRRTSSGFLIHMLVSILPQMNVLWFMGLMRKCAVNLSKVG